MLYFVVGMPGAFAEWCDEVTARLAARAAGSSEVVRADSLEEISRNIIRINASAIVVSARQPGGRLRSALVENDRAFLVAVEDARVVLAHLVIEKGIEFPVAVKVVASSCGAVAQYMDAPGAISLVAHDHRGELAATVASIAQHLRFELSDADIVEIVRVLEAVDGRAERRDIAAWWNELASNERETAEGALAPYASYFKGGDLSLVKWTSELFFLGDRPIERATGVIDITGRARCLMRGPYIMLPAACWTLSLELLFSREAAEHDFSVEVVAGKQLASRRIRPGVEGPFETDLTFVVDELNDNPIDIRFSNERPAFDGALRLIGATLGRQPEAVLAPAAVEAASRTEG
jgi:hypothetical protein